MRADCQEIFKLTPHEKQVMMFSATLNQEMRAVCKKFMSNVRYLRAASLVLSVLRARCSHRCSNHQTLPGSCARSWQGAPVGIANSGGSCCVVT